MLSDDYIVGYGHLTIPEHIKKKFLLYVPKKYTIETYLRKTRICTEKTITRFFGEAHPSHCYVQRKGIIFDIMKEGSSRRLVDIHAISELLKRSANEESDKNSKRKKSISSLGDATVVFSSHALEQFAERYMFYAESKLSHPEERARQLLEESTEKNAISEVGVVKRLIDNKFEEVRYFRNGKWRFVVLDKKNGTYFVKTIEYAYLK